MRNTLYLLAVLVFWITIPLSNSASLLNEDDTFDELETFYPSDVAEAQKSNLLLGTLFFKYTSDDPGSLYEPYGSVNIVAGGTKHSIWNVLADTVFVPLDQGVTVPFNLNVVSLQNLKIKGYIYEDDSSSPDDEIATMDQPIDLEGPGQIKEWKFNGEDGHATVSIQYYSIN